MYSPLDSKPGDPRLLSKDVPPDTLELDLLGGIRVHLFVVILVVDIVADTDELPGIVGTDEKDDGGAEDFGGGDTGRIWRVRDKLELVYADGNRPDEQ